MYCNLSFREIHNGWLLHISLNYKKIYTKYMDISKQLHPFTNCKFEIIFENQSSVETVKACLWEITFSFQFLGPVKNSLDISNDNAHYISVKESLPNIQTFNLILIQLIQF